MKRTILIVDDSVRINQLVKMSLMNTYAIVQAFTGEDAVATLQSTKIDLVLLDITLPKMSGYDVLPYITDKEIPVIFLTAKTEVADVVQGLQLGADDYITKPFHLEVLKSRVEAVMRRVYGHTDEIIKYGDLVIDVTQQTVRRNGELVDLTNKEFELLVYFVRNQGVTLARETLYENIWDFADDMVDTRTVDLHVQRLRKKLGLADRITTVFRVGYRMETL
ncbi:response regulator transcription factor [Weissella confusa]|uniref:Response regulator transcription factor n=1 Tax=Weissella confusa TaxID=1583 RepID=A0A4Z0RNA8_WEICO|nr:response regulator transcription factor [Weissella confusa]MBJ7615291.1 response regulator transcription factor [Weissella confusa]MBJ7625347.1 response regulator transcription factor [Weissella confusa]MBJ7628014.1 response regulator transcription factor [Weissella confusa]MBJ7632182.1 response regulator transcription factor [Weissella confusa]MBJ7638134.1 response regulator transcription factor [Weissella confusa]